MQSVLRACGKELSSNASSGMQKKKLQVECMSYSVPSSNSYTISIPVHQVPIPSSVCMQEKKKEDTERKIHP